MKKHKLKSAHTQGALKQKGITQGLGYSFFYASLIIRLGLHYITFRGTVNRVMPDCQQGCSLLNRVTLMSKTASQQTLICLILNAAILLTFDPPHFIISSRASYLYGSIVLVTMNYVAI
jgi:hypothetical protein